MNEQLREALTTLLDKSLSAVDFMVAELPEVIQQLLLWKMWENLIYFTVSLIAALTVWVVATCLYRNDNSHDRVMWFVFAFLVSLVVLLLGFNVTWLQILIAPKVYLIEYAASLAK